MFGVRVVIQPTAGLTFRRLPSSILHISTYPFLPPTTMSGFLRRLVILQHADARFDVATLVKHQETNREIYTLPRDLVAVGAYPEREAWWVHTTKRQGTKNFRHAHFSMVSKKVQKVGSRRYVIFSDGKREAAEDPQLHDWDYLMCEKLTGYVLSENHERLAELAGLTNRGCKLGKEGFAFVVEVSEPREFWLETTTALPTTVVPGTQLVGVPCDAFPLFRHAWGSGDGNALNEPTPSPVKGYVPFMVGIPDAPIEMDYFTDGNAFIPKALVDELQREDA